MPETPNLSDLISERMSEMRAKLTGFEEQLVASEDTESERYIQSMSRALAAQVMVELLIDRLAPELIPAIRRAAENLERKLGEEEHSEMALALRKGVIEVLKSAG